MELVTVFRTKRKIFCVVCRKHQERLKKMTCFTETIIQGSSNFRASGLSDHDKIPMTGFIL